jgi:hypothetical protein
MIDSDNPSRTAGTVSLVLGILAVVPFGALAGVPAVVLGIYALREEPRSRNRAWAGAVLGGLGTAMTVALILFTILIAGRSRGPVTGSDFAVTDPTLANMFAVQSSLEDWAKEHGGVYPYDAEFDSDSSLFMRFMARDRVG